MFTLIYFIIWLSSSENHQKRHKCVISRSYDFKSPLQSFDALCEELTEMLFTENRKRRLDILL